MQNNSISFSGTNLSFLKRQGVMTCAWCGQPVLSERKLTTKLFNALQTAKGGALTQTLDVYFAQFADGRTPKSLLAIRELAESPQFKDTTFKNLLYHVKDKKIDYSDMRKTIRNLFSDIVMSLDHIIPKFDGGLNSQCNYLPMHAYCNNARKSTGYAELIQNNPNFIENIRETIRAIKQASESKTLRVVPNYFQNLLANLEQQGIPARTFEDLRF